MTAIFLTVAAVAISQIEHGVPSARQRAGSPATVLAGGWDQKVLATGAASLENPTGIFTNYGYLNDAAAQPSLACTPAYTPQTSGLRTKTEPDQNTYITTTSNPGGPAASYDYGRHFLVQGHEVFGNAGAGVGQTNSAYLTRINLDVPLTSRHRITLLGMRAGADGCSSGMAAIDGSTYDPFTGQLLFGGETGGTGTAAQAYGGIYATDVAWSSTTAPAVTRLNGSIGYGGFEGVQLDDRGNLYIEEDSGGSTIANGVRKPNSFAFRFVPTSPSDLTAGKLQALQVSVSGTPLTFANADPIAGTADKRLYSGETLSATWVTVHDTAVEGTASFDANAAAKAADATPFKRPENGRFVPESAFKSFVFTVTGDTSAAAINNQTPDGARYADRGAAGAIMRIDMATSGATAATVRAIVPADGEHAAYDSIAFLDKNTLLVGEDRGEGLHTAFNALDSTWAFDLTKSFEDQFTYAKRLIAQGRDPEATADVDKKEATPAIADQNDGDNEVTGVLVSNGVSTISSIFGTSDPAALAGTRMFYTGQHGANATYELIAPGPDSGTTPPGTEGPPGTPGTNGTNGTNATNGTNGTNGAPGTNGTNGTNGSPGTNGAPATNQINGADGTEGATGSAGRDGKDGATVLCVLGKKKVTCKVVKASSASVKASTRARLVRQGKTYATGTVGRLTRTRGIVRGLKYTLQIGSGKKSVTATVVLR